MSAGWESHISSPTEVVGINRLLSELEARFPGDGWGSLDDADMERVLNDLSYVVRVREYCSLCPGIAICRRDKRVTADVRPNGTVPRKVTLHYGATGARVDLAFGKCDRAREE